MKAGGETAQSPEIARPVPIVIHGSFGKHLEAIGAAAEILNSTGVAVVVAPHNCEAVGQQGGFVLFEGEEGKDPRDVEAAYIEQILRLRVQGGASLFVTPNGYIGRSAAYEAGIIQACGGRAFWTEQPNDVPFYVDPATIITAEKFAQYLREHKGMLPPLSVPKDPLSQRWQTLSFPTAYIAEGAILYCGDKLLLVEDGRWNGQLTIPGTKVLPGESRSDALRRLTETKIGGVINHIAHFATSLAVPGSEYRGSVDPEKLVFEDHTVQASSEHIHPQPGLKCSWTSLSEIETLVADRQIEPNAAALLRSYLVRTS